MNVLVLALLVVLGAGLVLWALPFLVYGIPLLIILWLLSKLFSTFVVLIIGIIIVVIFLLKQ